MPRKYPHLVRDLKWCGLLTDGEAESAIAAYKRGDDYACEAVWHYGGPRKLIERAVEMRTRLRDLRLAGIIS